MKTIIVYIACIAILIAPQFAAARTSSGSHHSRAHHAHAHTTHARRHK